jgi:prevent-host-death family protein
METIDIIDAEKRFGDLVDRAAAGEDIIIAREGKPVARLTQIERLARSDSRQPGRFAGLSVPEQFFDQLPDEEVSAWE